MSVPFNPVQGLIIIPATILGPAGSIALRLALDTGATETSISRFMLTQAGYRFSNALTVPVVMGSGVVSIPLVTLDSLGALGQTQAGLIVQAYTLPPSLPIDGVLGLDFIRRGRLVVDFRTGQISLT